MRLPSIETLSRVFAHEAKHARAILEMTYAQLCAHPVGAARYRQCFHPPSKTDLCLHILNSLDNGLFGVEACTTTEGESADYLNAGDTYAETIIYWRGAYRVQTLGDFIEIQQRRGVQFEA